MAASLSGYYQSPELDSKMPVHDHSLRKLYTIEGPVWFIIGFVPCY